MGRKLIPVLPKNYRRIALRAVAAAADPVVLMNRRSVDDLSEHGALTQAGIRGGRDFEVRDGDAPILGFHDPRTRCGYRRNTRRSRNIVRARVG